MVNSLNPSTIVGAGQVCSQLGKRVPFSPSIFCVISLPWMQCVASVVTRIFHSWCHLGWIDLLVPFSNCHFTPCAMYRSASHLEPIARKWLFKLFVSFLISLSQNLSYYSSISFKCKNFLKYFLRSSIHFQVLPYHQYLSYYSSFSLSIKYK